MILVPFYLDKGYKKDNARKDQTQGKKLMTYAAISREMQREEKKINHLAIAEKQLEKNFYL